MLPAVNFHVWEPCNMRCKFCFATFQDVKQSILPKGHLSQQDAIRVVEQLAEVGFEKITFAGGEPTLCRWLWDLITTAKNAGLTTMIVTNGSKLTESFLTANRDHLDWIAVSIDSIQEATNLASGRAVCGSNPFKPEYYFSLADMIKSFGYGFKINTVVNRSNYLEDLGPLIRHAQPKRWKLFQALPIAGQNDQHIDDFTITQEQFDVFISNHASLQQYTNIVPENNNEMRGSYAMVDPAGRFYDNVQGTHRYSRPILEIGGRLAMQQVSYDFSKFVSRQGVYNWKINK